MFKGPEILTKNSILLGEGGEQRMVQRVARERWGTKGIVKRKSFARWFIGYCQTGRATYADDRGQITDIVPNSLFVMRPNRGCEIRVQRPMTFLLLVAEGERATTRLSRLLLQRAPVQQIRDGDLAPYFNVILNAAQQTGLHRDAIIDHLLFDGLLLRLDEHYQQIAIHGSMHSLVRAKRLADLRDQPYHSVEEWAQDCQLDRAYLSRLFKNHIGMPASHYLTKLKLEKARDLLLTTDDTLDLIADQASYTDKETFGKAFKKSFGTSPGRYRRQWQPEQTTTGHLP